MTYNLHMNYNFSSIGYGAAAYAWLYVIGEMAFLPAHSRLETSEENGKPKAPGASSVL